MNECFPFVQNYYVNRCTDKIFLEKPSSHQVLKTSGGIKLAPPRVQLEKGQKIGNSIDIQNSIKVRNCATKDPDVTNEDLIDEVCVGPSKSGEEARKQMVKVQSYARSFIRYLFDEFGTSDSNKMLLTKAFDLLRLNVKYGEEEYREGFFSAISLQIFFIHEIYADIVAHEMTHRLLHDSDLMYSHETGALIESFSDILGVALKNQINPGTDIYESGATEKKIYEYLDDMVTYYDANIFGDDKTNKLLHQNGGISSTAFYLLAQGGTHHKGESDIVNDGIGIVDATKIFFDAFMGCMTTYAGFQNARYCTINAASDENRIHVHKAWESVGVKCNRFQDDGNQDNNNKCEGIERPVRGKGLIILIWDKHKKKA